MISYSVLSSAGGTAQYMTAERTDAQAEYYAQEDVHTAWGGKGAEIAGFKNNQKVTGEALTKVLEGKLLNPATGKDQQVGRIQNGELEHRPGIDLTFSAPKSVSIVGIVGRDERVLAAHEAAISKSMGYLEEQASTRVRGENNQIDYKNTGNLVYAKVQHETSRDLDPQLHTHVAIANATYDSGSEKWRSLEYNSLIRDIKTADAIYKNELANNLKTLGYDISWTKNGPEISGINRTQIEHFSKRTEAIDKALNEKGLSREEASAGMRGYVALETRDKKIHLGREELNQKWQGEAKLIGLDVNQIVEKSLQKQPALDVNQKMEASKAVTKALKHLGENEQAFTKNELIRFANEFSTGKSTSDQINKAIERFEKIGEIVSRGVDEKSGRQIVTTLGAIQAEQKQAQQILENKYAVTPMLTGRDADVVLSAFKARSEYALDAGQRDAATMVLTSPDRMTAVQGYAGAGKTSMIAAIKVGAEKSGYEVVGLSNGAVQAEKLGAESGIKSQTVASFLLKEDGSKAKQQLWVVDEASQLSLKDWNLLQEKAIKNEARIVFVGDKEQHQSVGAGRAFENAQAAMTTTTLTTIYRQKDQVGKEAVQEAIAGRMGEAFDKIVKAEGQSVEVRQNVAAVEAKFKGVELNQDNQKIKLNELSAARDADSKALIQKTAELYLSQEKPTESTLIFTATNASRIEINEAVRDKMKEAGQLKGNDINIISVTNLKMTDAQKKEGWRYEAGMAVQADRAYKAMGVERGDQFKVISNDEKKNVVHLENLKTGKQIIWNPEARTGFSAFELNKVGMAIGDAVRFTKNERDAGISNGTKGIVVAANEKFITVEAGGKMHQLDTKDALHLQHRYASTTYKDQGNQAEKGIYVIDTNRAGGVGTRDAYVGFTRAQKGTIIVSNDMNKARDLVQREQNKTAVIEKQEQKQEQKLETKQEQKIETRKEQTQNYDRGMSF